MLRESSVPYSSLPQEEGEQSYVTTRSSGEPNTHSKTRLISIIILLLILLGVPLLVIAPLAISRGWQLPTYGIPYSGSQKIMNTSDSPNVPTNIGEIIIHTIKSTTSIPEVTTTTPIKQTTFTTSASTTTTPAPTTTTTPAPTTTTPAPTTTMSAPTTTTPAPTTKPTTSVPITKPIIIPPTVLKPIVETAVGVGKNQTGNTTDMKIPGPQEGSASGSESGNLGGDSNDSYSFTNTQNISSMINKFMSKHEWWTVVGLAVVATLALAAVITMVAWIIKNCLASRRRKTDLHKVITDLQSRDKVVLLNSEDTDEEP